MIVIPTAHVFANEATDTLKEPSPGDWDGRRMGIVTGSSFEPATLENFPNSEYFYYNTNSDVVTALTTNKIVLAVRASDLEELISSKVSDVKEFTYYQTMPDMVLGIKSGKTDAGFMNNAVAELAANKDPALAVFPESLGETAFGLAFAKGGSNDIIKYVASTVVKNLGMKNGKQQIYRTVIAKYGQNKGLTIYNHIKKYI